MVSQMDATLSVHTLLSHDHLSYYLFSIRSFLLASSLRCRIFVYDDGSLNHEDRTILRSIIRDVRVVFLDDYEAAVPRRLFPHARAFMEDHPLGRRLLGVAVMNATPKLVILDSDVLFFRRPISIVRWAASRTNETRFNRDSQRVASVGLSPGQFAGIGGSLIPYFNAGLLCTFADVLNIRLIETTLRCLREAGTCSTWIWDQTVWAAMVSRYPHRPLPSVYGFHNLRGRLRNLRLDRLTSMHFSAPRSHFFSEGVQRLLLDHHYGWT